MLRGRIIGRWAPQQTALLSCVWVEAVVHIASAPRRVHLPLSFARSGQPPARHIVWLVS